MKTLFLSIFLMLNYTQSNTEFENIEKFLFEEYQIDLTENETAILFFPLNGCMGVIDYLLTYFTENSVGKNSIVIISSNYIQSTDQIEKILQGNKNVYWDNKNKIPYSNLGIVIPTLVSIKNTKIIDKTPVTASNIEVVKLSL